MCQVWILGRPSGCVCTPMGCWARGMKKERRSGVSCSRMTEAKWGPTGCSPHPQTWSRGNRSKQARLVVRPLSLLCFLENFDASPEQRLSWTSGASVSGGWARLGKQGATAMQRGRRCLP